MQRFRTVATVRGARLHPRPLSQGRRKYLGCTIYIPYTAVRKLMSAYYILKSWYRYSEVLDISDSCTWKFQAPNEYR